MWDLRKKAHTELDGIPNEVKSNATGDEKKLFEKLADGKTHESLQQDWEATKHLKGKLRTVCIDFVVWYTRKIGVNLYKTIDPKKLDLNVDGYFNLEATLKKAGKSHAWIPASSGKLPQFGDILRHSIWHVDVSLGVDKGILERIAGGQSSHPRPATDVTKEYDNILRIRGKKEYDPNDLQGWLDIDLFDLPPPGPTPAWVTGWWKVTWRNVAYYYYLSADGTARWTKIPQTAGPQPPPLPISAPNRGTYAFSASNEVTIRWYDSESLENFQLDLGAASIEMAGTWNGTEAISAKKLQ